MNLKEAVERSDNEKFSFPDIIDSKAGLFELPDLNIVGVSSWKRNINKRRKAILEIRTFRGISSGAVHFYGKIIADGVYTAHLDDIESAFTISYELEEKYPLLQYSYEFVMKRPITKEEIDASPDKLYYLKDGDLINKFNTMNQLINDAKEIFKLRFTGDWDYYIQYPAGRKEKIIL